MCMRPFEASSTILYPVSDWSTGWLSRGGAYVALDFRTNIVFVVARQWILCTFAFTPVFVLFKFEKWYDDHAGCRLARQKRHLPRRSERRSAISVKSFAAALRSVRLCLRLPYAFRPSTSTMRSVRGIEPHITILLTRRFVLHISVWRLQYQDCALLDRGPRNGPNNSLHS